MWIKTGFNEALKDLVKEHISFQSEEVDEITEDEFNKRMDKAIMEAGFSIMSILCGVFLESTDMRSSTKEEQKILQEYKDKNSTIIK